MDQLSKREKEVIRLLLQGKSNKQIAYLLGISVRTVEFHLKNIYAKFQVSSRIELILKLLNPPGQSTDQQLWYSTVDKRVETTENRDWQPLKMVLKKICGDKVFINGKVTEIKKRWGIYLLAGLAFGAGYWHYFSITAQFFNNLSTNLGLGLSDTMTILDWGLFLSSMLTYFGIWLLPAILPAVYEFRHSASVRRSAIASVTLWMSAVLGYYINYIVMLALVGLPHMEYYVILGQKTISFWQDWAEILKKLILAKMGKWVLLSIIAGGLAGFVVSSAYSRLIKRNRKTITA